MNGHRPIVRYAWVIGTVALVVQAYTQTGLARQISLGCLAVVGIAVLIRLALEVTKRYRKAQIHE